MSTSQSALQVHYPRRRVLRWVLQFLTRRAFDVMSDLEVIGRENIPDEGPLIVVANHFSFLDPALMIGVSPWPLEFLGGTRLPNAPGYVSWIPNLWGYFKVLRGTGSRRALRAAEQVLKQGGVVGVYPEASSHAAILRRGRPGTAFLAARSGARILPMGFDGLPNLFPRLREGKRAKVTVRIGKPFGPFGTTGHGRERRRQLDAITEEIMRHIAELLPPEKRGVYSEDPAQRAVAARLSSIPHDLDL